MPEYTTTEIAAQCRVSERTIQRWMKSGQLPAQELRRNLYSVSDADIARLQPRVSAPPAHERIQDLEARMHDVEMRIHTLEQLYQLEHQKPTPSQKPASRPSQPQKQASGSDTLPPDMVPIFDLIKAHNLTRQRKSIIANMEKAGYVKTGHWKVAGHEVRHALDQEGQAEFMRRYGKQA